MNNNNIDYYRDAQNFPYYIQKNGDPFKKFYINYINDKVDDSDEVKDYEREFYEFLKEKVGAFIGKIPYDHIVLLLGAGASVVENKNYGKTMNQLALDIFSSMANNQYDEETDLNSEDLLPYEKILKFLPNSKDVIKKFPKLEPDPKDKDHLINNWKGSFPLEDLISRLDFYIKGNEYLVDEDNKGYFNQVCNTKNYIIYKIFKNVNYDKLDDENMPFNHMSVVLALTKLLRDLSEKLTIVTTNYDLAIEKSLAKSDFSIFNGFNLTNDSVFDESSFDWVLSKRVDHINTHEVIYKPNMVNLFKIHGSINWLFDGKKTKEVSGNVVKNSLISQLKNSSRKNLGDDKNSNNKKDEVRMIFPSTNKYMQSYEEPYFDLISRFQEELHKANTLLVTSGFSFGDDHISRMVINAIKHNSSLKCLFTDYGIYNSQFYKYDEIENNEEIQNIQTSKKENAESKETLYGNKNWRDLDELRNEGYDIAFLKATMNDKKHGLAFFLRG